MVNKIAKVKRWTMGLTGNYGLISNLTAVGLVCLMFWRYQEDSFRRSAENFKQSQEDRHALIEAIRANQGDLQWRFDHVSKTQTNIEYTVKMLTEQLRYQVSATKELRDQIKRMLDKDDPPMCWCGYWGN